MTGFLYCEGYLRMKSVIVSFVSKKQLVDDFRDGNPV
jgi:hypothetical protein